MPIEQAVPDPMESAVAAVVPDSVASVLGIDAADAAWWNPFSWSKDDQKFALWAVTCFGAIVATAPTVAGALGVAGGCAASYGLVKLS